jgi:hypothetical protein
VTALKPRSWEESKRISEALFRHGARASCPVTTHGWVWYCDEHVTHGNADSEDEAEVVGAAHETYYGLNGEECALYIVEVEAVDVEWAALIEAEEARK